MSKRTAIEEVLHQHDKHFNKIDFSKWLSDNRKKIIDMEIDLAEMYSHFCVVCDRQGRPLIKFKDFIKLNQNKDEYNRDA